MIDLLPPNYKTELTYAKRNVTIRWYVVSAFFIVVTACLITIVSMWFSQRELERLSSDIKSLDDDLASYESIESEAVALRKKLSTVQELFDKQTNYLGVLEDIENATTPEATLLSLSLIGDDSLPLSLQFIVPSETAAASLRIGLEQSDRFSFVDIQSIGQRGDGNFSVEYKLAFEKGRAR